MNHQLLSKIKTVTNDIHSHVDAELTHIKKACQKGCTSCCHQIVDVITWEEPKIFEYILTSLDRKVKRQIARNLKKWFKTFNSNTRDATRNNPLNFWEVREVQHVFREKRVPCPFLISSQCAIYEARPMVCRVHYAEESVEQCKNDPHKITPLDAQLIFTEAAKSFEPEMFPIAMKPLPYLVVQEFGVEVVSRPMIGVVYDPRNVFDRT